MRKCSWHGHVMGACALWASLLLTSSVSAHHGMGGEAPSSWQQALAAGLAHPLLDLPHLLFVFGIAFRGRWSAAAGTRSRSAVTFIGVTLVGCVLQVTLMLLPVSEPVLAISVVVLGLLLVTHGLTGPFGALAWVFAGLLHGSAYGEAMTGASSETLTWYLVGLLGSQLLLYTAASRGLGWLGASRWSTAALAVARHGVWVGGVLCLGLGLTG